MTQTSAQEVPRTETTYFASLPREMTGTKTIHLALDDAACSIGPDTYLARALNFPAGHGVLSVWRANRQEHEFFDATCTVIVGG
jgi:hypothetical protein